MARNTVRLSDGGAPRPKTAKKSGTTARKSLFSKVNTSRPAVPTSILLPGVSAIQPNGTTLTGPSMISSGTGPARTPAPAPVPAPSIQSMMGGGGAGGGGGGGGLIESAPGAPAAPPEPAPMRDVDWFNQDGIFRRTAGGALSDLKEQLANILSQRDQAYREADTSRDALGRARTEDLRATAGNFSNRGLKDSGFFAQETDRVGEEYARRGSELDNMVAQLAQQMGQRNAQVDLNSLSAQANNGMGDLSGIFGRLGSMGVGAGNAYTRALAEARNQSAARASAPLINTFTQ